MEIVPGVHQFKIPIPDNPLGHLNSYLIQGDKGCLLVDTGWNTDEAFLELEGQLRALGLWFRDISMILITHVHPDHYGLAGRIKQNAPTRFAFHLWEKALIESRYIHFSELEAKIGRFLRSHGVPEETADPLQRASLPALEFVTVAWPDEVLYGGETINIGEFQLEVIWTPGHSPGHLCLYEPSKRLLFSGDHILPSITPNVSYHLQSGSNPLGDYVNALQQLKRLPVDLVLPAHEEVFQNVEGRIEAIIRHHDDRKRQILGLIAGGPKPAYQIAQELPWNVGDRWTRLDPLVKRFAVMETIAHLELFRMEAQVRRFTEKGIIYYEMSSP
ncbi:MAG: MBL fold metallo-hydrolase [Dehalococcoidia bacterium]|nr:MBL fold metallo-hydrolase [Dehalococcoidia bacterium]